MTSRSRWNSMYSEGQHDGRRPGVRYLIARQLLIVVMILYTASSVKVQSQYHPLNGIHGRPCTRCDGVVFGVISTPQAIETRFKQYVLQYWNQDLKGAVYLEHDLNAQQKVVVPAGMVVRTHAHLAANLEEAFDGTLGARGIAMFIDLHELYPDAMWYLAGDDDTVWVVQNLADALAGYNPHEPYYIGGLTDLDHRWRAYADYAYGGGGVILSRAALLLMLPTLPACMRHLHTAHTDQSIGRCAAAHGIPLTKHGGMHQHDLRSVSYLLQNHPAVPLLSIHYEYHLLPNATTAYLAAYPAGLAQKSVCVVPGMGRMVYAAGYSVRFWATNAKGTGWGFDHIATNDTGTAVTFPVMNRARHLASYRISSVEVKPSGGRTGQQRIVTTYTLQEQHPSIRANTVRVDEPLLDQRWLHAPLALCCSSAEVARGVLRVQWSKQWSKRCLRHW